jgi:septal ring factor EnvC (AmiA/AmiB activator)
MIGVQMLSRIKIKIIIYLFIAAVCAWVFYKQRSDISNLKESVTILSANNAKLQVAVSKQNDTITSFESQIRHSLRNNEQLRNDIRESEKKRNEITEKFNSYRGRLYNAAIKKPSLIERRANSAIADVLQQFARETGNQD